MKQMSKIKKKRQNPINEAKEEEEEYTKSQDNLHTQSKVTMQMNGATSTFHGIIHPTLPVHKPNKK